MVTAKWRAPTHSHALTRTHTLPFFVILIHTPYTLEHEHTPYTHTFYTYTYTQAHTRHTHTHTRTSPHLCSWAWGFISDTETTSIDAALQGGGHTQGWELHTHCYTHTHTHTMYTNNMYTQGFLLAHTHTNRHIVT